MLLQTLRDKHKIIVIFNLRYIIYTLAAQRNSRIPKLFGNLD